MQGFIRARLVAVSIALSTVACATSFTGEAHVEGGRSGCAAKCQAWGMDLTGMVAMGEYSDACVCRLKGAQAQAADESAVAGGTVGVALQMQAQRRNQMVMMPAPIR